MIAKAKKKKSTASVETTPPTRTAPHQTMMPYKFEPYQTQPGEAYMNEKQLKHFRSILEEWKKDLMQEVDNTIIEMKEESVHVLADPNDRATQEEIFNLELRTRDRERKLIRKIEDTLQQIEDKEYGHCEMCGIEIGIRRLEARPTATLCIDCKTLDEIREKRTAQ
jgi:DnaK suppressor protein